MLGTYFRDGRRKIDFVLVHEEANLAYSRSSSATQVQPSPVPHRPEGRSPLDRIQSTLVTSSPNQSANSKRGRKIDIRQTFLDKLQSQGIEIEEVCFLS